MPDPLAITFDYLAATENVYAVDTLLAALDVDNRRVRALAAAALARRRSSRGHIELIRRLGGFSPEMRTEILRHAQGMENAVRQCLLHGDDELRANALSLIEWLEDYSQMPALLSIMEDPASRHREAAGTLVQNLLERLYDHLHPAGDGTRSVLRDADRIRESVIADLEQSCQRFESHGCECVIEALLALAEPEHQAIKKLLRQPGHPCRERAEQLLLVSKHPGVMAKLTGFLAANYPPQRLLQIFKLRQDADFMCHVLQEFPRRLTETHQHNYRHIDSVGWLQPDDHQLHLIPPMLQPRLVAFLQATKLPEKQKFFALEWLLRHGDPEAREAATKALTDQDDRAVQEVVIEGLYSEDPEVQAWATSQLRARGIPQTFAILIERLDSPLPEVQEAARVELQDFSLKRLLDLFDSLTPATCILAGKLLQKIDPEALEKLKRELFSPMRSKRLRAARLTLAIGVQNQLVEALIQLGDDEDILIRRTAAEVLGKCSGAEVLEVLQGLLHDPSPRVREAAERSLEQVRERIEPLQPAASRS